MSADVVIAGGGPNGLMLACELSLAGVRPVVLERLPERTRENRANGLIGQVVRMLDRRGLSDRVELEVDVGQDLMVSIADIDGRKINNCL